MLGAEGSERKHTQSSHLPMSGALREWSWEGSTGKAARQTKAFAWRQLAQCAQTRQLASLSL